MEKILTQEEINALLYAAQNAGKGSRGAPRFSPFVFGKAAPISKEQVREVAQLHEAFVYRLKSRISSYLQIGVEINPMAVEEAPYTDFVQSLPQSSYLASIGIQPTDSLALLSLDLPVAFSMIDLMLGGNGKPSTSDRRVTEIEERVLQTILDMTTEELQSAWRQVVGISFSFDKTQRAGDLFRLMPPYEKVLSLSFEIRLLEAFSTLTLAFPAAVSSLLLQKLTKRNPRAQRAAPGSSAGLRKRLERCTFNLEMLLPPTKIRGQDLLKLRSGQTILIEQRLSQPAVLTLAGKVVFTGYPVRNGSQRAGMIHEKSPVGAHKERVHP